MSKFKDYIKKYFKFLGKMYTPSSVFEDTKLGNGLSNVFKSLTGSGLTSAQQEANAFNSAEAQKQRDWQTEMSNTTYQRAVADMKKAGINPAMLYGGASSASVSGGSSATSVSPSSDSGAILSLVSSMFNSLLRKDIADKDRDVNRELRLKEMELTNKDINNRFSLYKSQIGLNEANTANIKIKTSYIPLEFGLKQSLNASQIEVNNSIQNLHQSQIAKYYSDAEFTSIQAALGSLDYKYREQYLQSMIDLNNATTKLRFAEQYKAYESVRQRDEELSLTEWARRQGDTHLLIEAKKVEKQIELMESQRVINSEQAKFLKSQRGWFMANQVLDNLIYKPQANMQGWLKSAGSFFN